MCRLSRLHLERTTLGDTVFHRHGSLRVVQNIGLGIVPAVIIVVPVGRCCVNEVESHLLTFKIDIAHEVIVGQIVIVDLDGHVVLDEIYLDDAFVNTPFDVIGDVVEGALL